VTNNFNFLAPIYDGLAKIIFGGSLRKAQLLYLEEIPKNSHILILGGGTGWILEELDRLDKLLRITYVELSKTMMSKSMAKAPFKNIEVKFLHGDAIDLDLPLCDVLVTNFFLDVFTEENLRLIMAKLNAVLLPNGRWLCTDFVLIGHFLKKMLIKFMYLFFRITANLEGNRLLDFEKYFEELEFKKARSKKYYAGMIEAACYSRSTLTI
jgi:tRNA (cmo5U34)-methyltransferase